MTPELYPLVLLALLAAITAVSVELVASLRAPACPQCVHCRLLAAQRRHEDAQRESAGRLWGDDTDDTDRNRRP